MSCEWKYFFGVLLILLCHYSSTYAQCCIDNQNLMNKAENRRPIRLFLHKTLCDQSINPNKIIGLNGYNAAALSKSSNSN